MSVDQRNCRPVYFTWNTFTGLALNLISSGLSLLTAAIFMVFFLLASYPVSFLLVTLKAAVQFVCGPDVNKFMVKPAVVRLALLFVDRWNVTLCPQPSQSPNPNPSRHPSRSVSSSLPPSLMEKPAEHWGQQGGLDETLSRLALLNARADHLES